MAQVDPKFSAGARLERKAFREYLRRQVKKSFLASEVIAYKLAVEWVMTRQARYDKKKGGLGK